MSGSMALLLSLSLGGSLLALLVLGLRLLLGRRLPSSFYYFAWLLVLLRFLLPVPGLLGTGGETEAVSSPVPSSQYSFSDSGSSPRDVRVGDLPAAAGPVSHSESGAGGFSPASAGDTEAAQTAAAPEAERPSLVPSLAAAWEAAAGFLAGLLKSPGFWLGLWGLGAAVSLLWYLGSYLLFSRTLGRSLRPAAGALLRQFREAGAPRRLRLCISSAAATPMLMGLFRPRLVLPEREYSPQMLKNIFLHELTHYRRGDLIFKWFAVLVTALHWFNPLVYLARRELDRACEMSCDESLLRRMDLQDKRSYGETLLSLAAAGSLPRRLVATSFATEKRNLRERLEQIMKYRPMGRAGLALLLAATLLLCGCAAALGPGAQEAEAPADTAESAAPSLSPSPVPTSEPRSVTVSTVDELLSAIGPNTTVILKEGVYDLSQASDFGVAQEQGYYTWASSFDGPELVISKLSGLSLIGQGEVTISAVPRYADVLSFSGCTDICLSGLTLGHTEEPGDCVGGVVDLTAVDSAIISQCRLFGCGVMGLRSEDSTGVQVVESEIYDCSYSAAQIYTSFNVVFNNCKIYDNETFSSLFYFNNSEACAVINCDISGNSSPVVLDICYSPNVYFAGNIVEDNPLSDGMFFIAGSGATVEGCSFSGNGGAWYASRSMRGPESKSLCPVDAQGNELSESQLQSMEHFTVSGWEPKTPDSVSLPVSEDGYIHVSTVDEFLAAIGPDSSIYLEDGVYDLSSASSYGGYGSQYYVWKDTGVDGPQLVICNLRGLSITGGGADKVSISAEPRYAEVLAFSNCRDIELSGFTAGHSQEPGYCVGGVLYFNESSNVNVSGCSLYGCGVWGVTAIDSSDIAVKDTEIYDCSSGDINLSGCRNVSFENCDIHDNGLSRIVNNCQQVSMDGESLASYFPPKYNELQCVFVAEPGVTLPEGLHIYYSVSAVKELSLPADTPIELSAGLMVSGQGSTALEEVTWSVSDGSKLSLEPRKHGACVVENLGSTGGSVTVTAEYEGQTAQLKINFVQELADPASYSGSQESASSNASATTAGDTFRITYAEEERTELTLNAGGQPIALSARGLPTWATVTWSIEGDDEGEYCTVESTGNITCQLTPLQAKSGGVTLVAEYDGMVKTCTVYLLPAVK